jgi:hypothetical protein
MSSPNHYLERVRRQSLCQYLMIAFCILFGVALIANTQIAGDGSWFWYATLFRQGKLIYADMHLALQPLFVLETAWFMAIFGKGWLVSKIPAALHLIAYTMGMLLIVRASRLSDAQKAIVIGSAFFLSVCSIAYRFDDYHVVAESLELYSLVLLLKLQKSQLRACVCVSVGLGVLSGLTFTTRVNDGAALIVGVGIALLCLAPSRKSIAFLVFGIATAGTVLLVVRLTGDSFQDYAATSIFKAAGGKGGTSHVLAYPLQLLWNTRTWVRRGIVLYILAASFAWAFLVRPTMQRRTKQALTKLAVGLLIIFGPLHHYATRLFSPDLLLGVTAISVYFIYGLGIFAFLHVVYRLFSNKIDSSNPLEILLIIPLGQLAAMSMSTGGFHYGVYGPEAMLILLLPVASPVRLPSNSIKAAIIAYAAILLCYCAVVQYRVPYAWHSYQAQRMFKGRQWYHHPIYGPMIIETKLLNFIQPICTQINSDKNPKSMLGIPNPFGNYFCAVPPWHDDVQTYYDTSTKETVDRMLRELEDVPPLWILYQREPRSLDVHEKVFSHGQPLPHRLLGELIENRLADGTWSSTYSSDFGSEYELDNQWILVKTRP